MKNKFKLAKQKSLEMALNVVIIFLVLILVIVTIVAAKSFKDAVYHHYDTSSFSYDLGYKDYSGMVYKYYQNKVADYQGNREIQEYYGVARFYEAATIYKAYATMEDSANMTFFKNKMKLAEAEMGDWIILKDDIMKELEIEE